jgi:hypothetical protein
VEGECDGTTQERKLRLKEKCLDQFLNQLGVKGEEKPLIVYGAASMNPSGKGELAVPVKYVYEKCKRKYETIRADERNTTNTHHKCEERTGRSKIQGVHDGVQPAVRWYQETGTHVRTFSECIRRKRDQDFYAGERTKVLPEVKSHTPPITKGNSPGERKRKRRATFA